MYQNMFWFDRALRSMLGATMLGLAFVSSEPILFVIGGILFATGTTGICPVHAVLGVNDATTAEPKPPKATISTRVA